MPLLTQIALDRALTPEEYAAALDHWQPALIQLARRAHAARRPVVVVFEGWDAADRGRAIKRLTERLDSRGYAVHADAPPAGEDATHHYLYRFWRRLPPRGRIAIFDGSWYSRVLADRGEGRCSEAAWRRAYRELNQFERQLVEFGTVVLKFWLHISPEEQARRFQALAEALPGDDEPACEPHFDPGKRAIYEGVVEEMLLKTSTIIAPWTIVEAHDQSWAGARVLRAAVEALEAALPAAVQNGDAAAEDGIEPAPAGDAGEVEKPKEREAPRKERGKVKARKE